MAVEGTMTNMTVGAEAPATQPTAAEVLGTPPEAPVAAPAPEPEAPRERASDRFAVLARKEQEVFRRAQAVRQQQAAIAKQAEEIRAFEAAKRSARLNPLEALKQLGLTYDDVAQYVLNDNTPTPDAQVQSVREELESYKRQMREEQESLIKQQQEQAAREQQAIVEQFREEVSDYIGQHADTYELTSLYGGASLVSDVIEEHFKMAGKLLTIPEAAKLVEEHYEDLARKAQATKKFAATKQQVDSAQAQTQAPAPRMGPTLTNSLTATATANPQRPRSDEDRIKAALARLEGR